MATQNSSPVLSNSPLGKDTSYISIYSPQLLYPIARETNRVSLGISGALPFHGFDVWNAFELSWLDTKGKPQVAIGEFWVPCKSPFILESKSLKLYLNSFNGTQYSSLESVKQTIEQDLSHASGSAVTVKMVLVADAPSITLASPEGICIDELDITCSDYHPNALLLHTNDIDADEILVSHTLKSNCPVTGQPDWATVQIHYSGKQIDHAGLLQYIVSYRDHSEFHEQCVERMFVDIMHQCKPELLTIEARYTRRGGLDINPFRSTEIQSPKNTRLVRQ